MHVKKNGKDWCKVCEATAHAAQQEKIIINIQLIKKYHIYDFFYYNIISVTALIPF